MVLRFAVLVLGRVIRHDVLLYLVITGDVARSGFTPMTSRPLQLAGYGYASRPASATL
jgi:hypothetical protein